MSLGSDLLLSLIKHGLSRNIGGYCSNVVVLFLELVKCIV